MTDRLRENVEIRSDSLAAGLTKTCLKVQLGLIPVQSRRAERCREAIASVSAAKQGFSVVRETERHNKALSHTTSEN